MLLTLAQNGGQTSVSCTGNLPLGKMTLACVE